MKIAEYDIEDSQSVFFIAEAGVNHDGDVDRAKELVEVAAAAGADAVKFQTFVADRLVTERAPRAEYQKRTTDVGSQYELLKRYELDPETHRTLQTVCRDRGILFLSTPFDPESADLLYDLDVPAIKLGSGELTNLPLLAHVASFGKPMVVSTGMGTMAEVEDAYAAIRSVDEDTDVTFLHCTSSYPTDLSEVNLRAMETMREELSVPVGYSDHTTAVETPAFATAAGAAIVEKHFTMDSSLPGPDHEASLEPDELERAVTLARRAAIARGSETKEPTHSERENIRSIRKSLHATAPIAPGDEFGERNVGIKRPATGLPPTELEAVLGKRAAVALEPGDPITSIDVLKQGAL